MTHIDRALRHVHTLDELARRTTALGQIDARAKVLGAFAILVTAASFGPYQLLRPLPLVILLAAGMALGDVPIRVVLSRLALASPLAILVGIWNPLFDPVPMVRLGSLVLSAGWVSFLCVVERFAIALAAVLVLIATTGFDQMAAALGQLGMPRVLVTQLLLLYRYAFVLGSEASRMLRAHALRAPDRLRPTWRTTRSLLGELLLRSVGRAERVHTAMLCRGFDGELRRSGHSRFGLGAAALVLGCIAFCAWVRCVDVPRWLGGLVS
ncbi:MAG: cobalt ECF transporter T component CbiQ [Polyangiaceae bacterium]|nr:cobalt ECF transporter T component CbiQ [Polyangiaceae bacterium]